MASSPLSRHFWEAWSQLFTLVLRQAFWGPFLYKPRSEMSHQLCLDLYAEGDTTNHSVNLSLNNIYMCGDLYFCCTMTIYLIKGKWCFEQFYSYAHHSQKESLFFEGIFLPLKSHTSVHVHTCIPICIVPHLGSASLFILPSIYSSYK